MILVLVWEVFLNVYKWNSNSGPLREVLVLVIDEVHGLRGTNP